ncbi:MAG: glutathione S-transferase [Oceanicoccus sp.]|jgi:glutathione S-transferase
MSDKLVLHQYQVSPFAAKVRRAMYFKALDFDVVNYGLSGAGKIKKLNPTGKAPVLEHQGKFIPDSTTIIDYLETLNPANPLMPADPLLKAQAHIIEDWADESLYFYDLTMRSWPNNVQLLADDLLLEDSGLMAKIFRALIPKLISKQASQQGIGRKNKHDVCAEMEVHLQSIETLVANNDFLVGADLTAADLAVVSMCTVLERAEEANAMMQSLPALMAWRERVDAISLPANTAADQKALI